MPDQNTIHIDQTHFELTDHGDIRRDALSGKFYFLDETSEANGPYDSFAQAEANLNIYLNHMINPVESLAADLINLLGGGNDMPDMLKQMIMLQRPIISAEERQAAITDAMIVIKESVQEGCTMYPDSFPTPAAAVQELAQRIIANFADTVGFGEVIKTTSLSAATEEDAYKAIELCFVNNMFTSPPDGDPKTWISNLRDPGQSPADICQHMTEGFFKQHYAHLIREEEADIPAGQVDTIDKHASAVAEIIRDLERNTKQWDLENVLVAFARNLQGAIIAELAADQDKLIEFLSSNRGGAVEDGSEATHMIMLLGGEFFIIVPDEDKESDVREQRWFWNEEGSYLFKQFAAAAAAKTIAQLAA